jgi:hypothetical protein
MVRPSGVALATASAPMLPPAPGLFSTITVPRLSLTRSASSAGCHIQRAAGGVGHDQADRFGFAPVPAVVDQMAARARVDAGQYRMTQMLRRMGFLDGVKSWVCRLVALSASVVNESAKNSSSGRPPSASCSQPAGGVHHNGRAAGIDLVAGQVG